MRVVFSTMLIILASNVLGKEASLDQLLRDDSELSQVSWRTQSISGYTTVLLL